MALRRPRHPMPAAVRRALAEAGVMRAYRERPAYQRNDYLGWIARAKRPETGERRLARMLADLARGDTCMGMAWRPRAPLGRPDDRRRLTDEG